MRVLRTKTFEVLENEAIVTRDIPEWTEEKSYARAERTRRLIPADHSAIDATEIEYVFEAAADNTTSDPASDPLGWIKEGASESNMLFDRFMNTKSKFAIGAGVTIKAQRISALFLGNFNGEAKIEVMNEDSEVKFEKTLRSRGAEYEPIASWYDYFYPDLIADAGESDKIVEFPTFYDMFLRVTALNRPLSIGKIAVGNLFSLGQTRNMPSVGVTDFSIKQADEKGNTYLEQRSYRKDGSFNLIIPNGAFDKVFGMLTALRAKPTVWIADERGGFSTLVIYGFYRNFQLVFQGRNGNECSLEIEGLA
jgi:hypothetical protein